jgi:hypothetical protein
MKPALEGNAIKVIPREKMMSLLAGIKAGFVHIRAFTPNRRRPA